MRSKPKAALLTNPSTSLLSAAVAGLLGVAAPGCASSEGSTGQDPHTCAPSADAGTVDAGAPVDAGVPPESGPVVTGTSTDASMTFGRFSAECTTRGGFVQTHAACFGNNSCRGVSYNRFDHVLTEHTCKSMNTCGGYSCVELGPDQGRTGEELFNTLGCTGCHDGAKFTVHAPASMTEADALARFRGRSRTAHARLIAFGAHGLSPTGVFEANMPGFHEKLSRAEALRLVDHLRSLEPVVSLYERHDETEETP
jgi:hypothetical protein